jgi:hypothetical protein
MSRLVAAAIAVSLLSTLLLAAFPFAQGSTEPGIFMSSNEASYVLGERVQLDGRIDFPLDLNNLLRMRVFTPSGEMFRIDEFKVNNNGGFSWSFTLPQDEAGEWRVNARFDIREVEIAINVLEADVFDKVYIESADLLDVRGNNITSEGAEVGENVAISTTLVNDEQEPQSFMLMVQILDEEGVAKAMLLTLGSLQPEESIERSASWLPDRAGSYTAEIFVWSSLNDPAPLVEKHSLAFGVSSQ